MRNGARRVSRRLMAGVSIAVMAACGSLSRATQYNWTGDSTDSNFSDPNNWNTQSGYPGSAGSTTDIAAFGSTVTTSNQPSLDISDSIGELLFQSTSGGWVLGTTSSSNVLTLNGVNGYGIDATAQTSGLTDIQANLSVGAAQTWAVGTGGTLEVDGIITGSSGLTVGASGATGTIELTALSTGFTGTVTIAGGTTLQLGGGASGGDGILGGPITLSAASSVLTFDEKNAETYGGLLTGPASSKINVNGSSVLTLTAASSNFAGTAKIGGGATLQLGNGTTAGSLGSSSTIALQSGSSPVSTLTFDEPSAQTFSMPITGPTGSVVNISGPSGGVTTTLANLNSGFTGTANILAKQTLQLGTGSSGGDGLFGTGSNIALAASTSTLNFNNYSARIYPGKISGPSSGGTINVNSDATLTLSALSTGFHGTINIAGNANASGPTTATLQLGTGASGGDAAFGTGSSIIMASPTGTATDAYLTFDENTTETFAGSITYPTSGSNVPNVYITGPGALTLSGTIAMNSEGAEPFLNFQGTGPVTLSGPITEPATGNAYFISSNTGSVTFSNTDVITKGHFNASGITGAGTPISGVTWNIANTGSVGNSSALTTVDYFTNYNTSSSSTAPDPVTFNVAGSIYTSEYVLGYDAGPVAMNLSTSSGSATIDAFDFWLGYSATSSGVNAGPIYAGLAVGQNATLINPTAATGYVYLLGFSANTYGYLSVAKGGTLTLSQATSTATKNQFYIGNTGNGMLEVGTLNGSVSSLGTVNVNVNNAGTGTPVGLVLNEGGGSATASEAAELNVYAGGTLNYTPYASTGTTIASGDTNFTANSLAGQFAAFNVVGGTVNDLGINSPVTLSTLAGATGILNLDSDANGVQGKLIASYVRAAASDSLAFVNFNGGELEYSNNNGTSPQGSLISTNVKGGAYIFPNGAIIGTNYSGNAPVNVTIPVALNAPTGYGVYQINVTAGGNGYSSPPIVEITGGGGSDATAVATISNGSVVSITVTSPGFGYSSTPFAVSILGDGATQAATATAITALNSSEGLGGLTKVDAGTLILSQSNTYGGPTLVNAGTLEFSGSSNATSAVTVLTTALNPAILNTAGSSANNIASAATILIGDVPTSASLANPATFTISNTSGFSLSSSILQTLGGFGLVTGSGTAGLTIGNLTVVAPGTGSGQVVQSLTATPGGYTTTGSNTASFNTGNKGNAKGTATGALTLGNQTGMTTTFAGGGTYFWKLNMDTGGSGETPTPGSVPIEEGYGDLSGTNWDALIIDNLNVTATPNDAFTIQAYGFTPTNGTATNPVTIGTGNDPSYAWTIARIGAATGNPPNLAGILADLSLNTSGLPTPSAGYGYYLTVQGDPQLASDADIVLNYSPVPEPSSAALLGLAGGLLLTRRRRRFR